MVQDNLANRTAVETRLARIKDSSSYRFYIEGETSRIDDVSLAWDALGLFITADDLTKAETYHQLVEVARRHGDKEVERFLGWISKDRPRMAGRNTRST